MTAATNLLDSLAEVGARVEAVGNRLVLRAGAQPVPGALVRRLREAKAEVLTAIAPVGINSAAVEARDWHRRQREALAHWSAFHSAREAASLAWGELENRWHRLHGVRVSVGQCAGCGAPIGDKPALDLADGCRVHLDTFDCLLDYGRRWRGVAMEALVAMGLHDRPADKKAG